MNNTPLAPDKIFLVTDIPGYTPNIARLICMMSYARFVTLQSVKEFTINELDYLMDEKSNSIGALLLHIASTDFYFQKLSFENRELTEEEFKIWQAAAKLGEQGRKEIRGNDLNYYIEKLNEVRNRTYELMKEKDDKWLETRIPFGKLESNYYHLWFHVFEDEINHRGQINLIKKRASELKP